MRFGSFELDRSAGELRKHGAKVKLQEQPFRILEMLAGRPGEVVMREELRRKLWTANTFVDFDHGLNKAVNKLRDALGDSAESPCFVETLPRRGYRFIAAVERAEESVPEALTRPGAGAGFGRAWVAALAVMAVIFLGLVGMALTGRESSSRQEELLNVSAAGTVRSLAVLPLENLAGNSEEEFFPDGMTDALITEMGKIGAVRVISRTSVMRYKNTTKTVEEIADELSVDAVVEGSVLRLGERVRVTVQLIGINPERQIWAVSFERPIQDVLALQREMARAIAGQIRVKLHPNREDRHLLTAKAREVHPKAHEAYLKGRYLWNQRTEKGVRKSLEYFRRALEIDPSYALGYSGLADAYFIFGNNGFLSPRDSYPKAKAAARKALGLDPTLAEAHAVLGGILDNYEWDWQGAEREYRRAIELNPNYATAHHWYAVRLSFMGNHEEALAEIERARELDPLSPRINANVGQMLFRAGRHEEAIRKFKEAMEISPDHFALYAYLGQTYVAQGRTEEAVQLLENHKASANGWSRALLGLAYAKAGKRSEARRELKRLDEISRTEYVSPYQIALIHASLGDREEAFTWLEKAYRDRSPQLIALETDPLLAPLRSDPRFRDLLRRMDSSSRQTLISWDSLLPTGRRVAGETGLGGTRKEFFESSSKLPNVIALR